MVAIAIVVIGIALAMVGVEVLAVAAVVVATVVVAGLTPRPDEWRYWEARLDEWHLLEE